MNRVAVLAIPATAAVLVFSACGGSGGSGDRTLRFRETDAGSTFQFIDNPPRSTRAGQEPGASAGDAEVITMRLLDVESKNQVGTEQAVCGVTVGGKNVDAAKVVCNGEIVLDDGTLAIQGLFGDDPTPEAAVTGGTGAYEGARGTFREQSGNPVLEIHLLD